MLGLFLRSGRIPCRRSLFLACSPLAKVRRGYLLCCAYPLLAIGNIGWIIRLWSDKQWYYDGAVSEMGQAYAEGIKALQTTGHLVAVIVLTAAVAILSIWLCAKIDRKSEKLFK